MSRAAVPLHERVRVALAHDIETGHYQDTGKLPAEPELCERFGVSRITVRRAVADLEERGLVRRRQGAGTYVMDRPELFATMEIAGFSDQLSGESGVQGRRIVRTQAIEANAELAARLGVDAGRPALLLDRVFTCDDVPITLDRSAYSLDRYPGLDGLVDESVSTYKVLRERYGVRFHEVRRTFTIGYTTKQTAAWLDRPESDPLIVIEKVALDADGGVIHLSHVESVPSRITLRMISRENG